MITALTLFCAALFVFAIALVAYVAFRFLSVVLSLDAALLREFSKSTTNTEESIAVAASTQPGTTKEYLRSRMTPTEGAFEPYSDEEAFLQEKVEDLRRQGMSEDGLADFVRQAVHTDIGKTD